MSTILITGGTGLVGTALEQKLKQLGYKTNILSRIPKENNHYKWDVKKNYIDPKAFKSVTHIVHLAGAGIANKRWSSSRKKEIYDSRINSTKLLFKDVKKLKLPLEKFICASGIGFYGAKTTQETFDENSQPDNDFIAKICIDWEKEARTFELLGIPQTIFRTGIVLAKEKSALQKMNTPVFLAGIGSGKQILPFIHIDDLCSLYTKAITDERFNGIYNAVAPEFQTMNSFMLALSDSTNKPLLPLNIPEAIIKTMLGELSVILLNGSKISFDKIVKRHSFKYPSLKSCFNEIFK